MTANNHEMLVQAANLLPGGVNSPVRAFLAVGGEPPFISRGQGARLWDIEGNEYVDYVGSWGPAILGHAEPEVVSAVCKAAQSGLSFGAPTALEVEFARVLTQRVPSIEMLRCVSSGTEATMSALRVARGFTGRNVIVKFNGGYHGHSDCLLVKAGSGAATFGNPDSAGVPQGMVEHTVVARYNDVAAITELFERRGSDIAAVIVEPVAGNMGCVAPEPGFLDAIVDLCTRYGAVSIFDEVMTGFRVAPGGAQERYGLKPDLTCLGKIVGGGMPLAVYGGRREIMQQIAPVGPVYQAGTLSGNPLAVTAGLVTLSQLTPSVYEHLDHLGSKLEVGLRDALGEAKVAGCIQRVGSMITVFFGPSVVRSWDDAAHCDTKQFGRFHQGLIQRGIYWPPAQFEAAFISNAHTEADIHRTIEAAKSALSA